MIKKILAVLVGMVLFGIVALAVIINMPSKERIDPLTYFGEFKEGQNNMVFEDMRVDLEKPVVEENGVIYISHEVLQRYVDKTIFYDAAEGIMTITTPQDILRLYRGGTNIKINGKPSEIEYPVLEIEGRGYLPENFVEERYDFVMSKGDDGRLYMGSDTHQGKQVAKVKSQKSELRTHPDKKNAITEVVSKNQELTVYKIENGYARVRSANGIIGFIPEQDIKIIGDTTITSKYQRPELASSKKPLDQKVRLVWDQMTVRTAGDWTSNKYTKIKNANVIAPTWFEFADEKGNLIDRGTVAYINNAHAKGMQVWPLMSHNFSQPQYTREILTSTNRRQNVINQLLEAADQYGFDGINIDIENIQEDFGAEWVQFMRELAPQMKQKGLTVSVDVYMPSAWSGHYQREQIAEVVDYFIVMAYDQHWSGSKLAGPVSGLDWVEEGIKANLQEVPAPKLVLGIPFFTRIWEESSEGVSSKAYGMDGSQSAVKQWGVPISYDEQSGLDYAEVTKGQKKYNVWLENESSVQKRIDLIAHYELAGYAGWKLGLENAKVWDILSTVK
ncbi:MAG: glycosyl hydrolase family 18 protein [Cellulosilyticaceae bacterium]